MDCKQVAQRLPWFLNGTLDEQNHQAIEAHLNHCPQCRKELEETGFAGQVYSSHIPVPVLLQFANGQDVAGWDSATIKAHLATCPDCDTECSLVQKSYQALETQPSESARWRFGFSSNRQNLLAAALLVAFFGVVMFELGTRRNPLKSPVTPSGSEAEIATITNYRNIDLFPVESPLRSTGSPSYQLTQNTPAISLTLHLRSQGDAGTFLLIVGDAEGNPLWRGDVTPHEDGTATLLLGKEFLSHEKLVMELFLDGHDEAFQRFELNLQKGN